MKGDVLLAHDKSL